jgi:hypothetical protein
MGKLKESILEAEENKSFYDEAHAEQEAKQEAYYYHVIAEFYGACKYFGTAKVMADLAEFKKNVEKPKDEPRIQLL